MKEAQKPHLFAALTIAGSDSCAGAGIQADLLTFAARGVYGTSVITCLTAQNPLSVSAVHAVPADFVTEQLNQLTRYFAIKALKTGMLYDAKIVEAVSDFLSNHPDIQSVVDPVMISTSGSRLLQEDAIKIYEQKLLPQATLITPNLDEASALLDEPINSKEAMREGAYKLAKRYDSCVLLKGGHLLTDTLFDVLATPDGNTHTYMSERIQNVDTHGSGCTLAAAITAELAKGYSLDDAIDNAHKYLNQAMRNGIRIGRAKFINHFPHIKK